jgi:hypothetical protein
VKIYLAGPLFTLAQRDFNARLKAELEELKHEEVWLPQEHERPNKSAQQIFDDDVAAIRRMDVVVANMDGSDPDSGTCWECGFAYGIGKPYLVFRTDFRIADQPGRLPFNPMLAVSGSCAPLILSSNNVDIDTKAVATAIHSALADMAKQEPI